jgi:hypothetical protein
MKKLIWAALTVLLLAIPSYAQGTPLIDVSGGYSLLRTSGVNMNGFNASGDYNANDWFGLAADVGFYHASPSGVGVNTVTYTFGPRLYYRKSDNIVPFAQALFGGSHLSASFGGFSASTSPFAFAFGGGLDLAIGSSGKFALRPEFNYFGLRTSGNTANSVRISVGIVYHIGTR